MLVSTRFGWSSAMRHALVEELLGDERRVEELLLEDAAHRRRA